jgi:hypothetical protein
MQKRKFKGEGKVQFLAKKEEIQSLLEKGWPVSAILDQLRDEGSITLGYHQFLHYVRRLIGGGTKTPDTARNMPPAKTGDAPGDLEIDKSPEAPERKKPRIGKIEAEPFQYNPNADISDFIGRKNRKPDSE